MNTMKAPSVPQDGETLLASQLAVYRTHFGYNVGAMERNGYIFPDDGRMHVALGMLSMGGDSSAVFFLGPKGGGKSRFGELAMGARNMVTLEASDMGGSILGQPNPISDEQKYVLGKLGEKLDPLDPRVFLDEFPQLRNKGALQPVMYGRTLMVAGQPIDMSYASRFATGNFSDGVRNFETDAAGLSRFGMIPLAGDLKTSDRPALYGRAQTPVLDAAIEENGVIPVAIQRKGITEVLREAYPAADNFGHVISDVISLVDNNPNLALREDGDDGRVSDAFLNTVRAMMLSGHYSGLETAEYRIGSKVDAHKVAQVAALVLPTQVELSSVGIRKISDALGTRNVPLLTQEVALRHALGAIGFQYWALGSGREDLSRINAEYAAFVNKRTYANPRSGTEEAIRSFREDTMKHAESVMSRGSIVVPTSTVQSGGEQNGRSSRGLIPRRRRNS